ncbi:MAG: hypothetical protein KIT09_30270 [Bryobacteraceae bacterium]|nr:hypothetical protein [Bryobacteraceae bacterium]
MRLLLILLCASLASGQPSGGDPWSDLRSKNAPDLEFSARFLDGGPYREGELIRLELRFPGGPRSTAGHPRQEMWQFGGFLLDPPRDCGAVESPCLMAMGFNLDKSDPMLSFGEREGPAVFYLNNYVPPPAPGRYRAAALARKLLLTSRAPMSFVYAYADPPEFAVSNGIEFEIVAASPDWIARTVAASLATLKGPQPAGPEGYEIQRAAAHQLRFLDHPSAWSAALELFPVGENTLLRGLAASRQPARVCELMQSCITAPRQAVSTYYLTTMAQLCAKPLMPAPPPGKPDQASPEWKAYWRNDRRLHQEMLTEGNAALAAGLSDKQGEAKAIAIETLLQRVQSLRMNEPERAQPEWLPALRREFVKSFGGLEEWRRRNLLSLYAAVIPGKDLVPILESTLDGWKPGDYYELPREAIRALQQVDAARAQARILAELRKEKTWLDAADLDLLPPSAVPTMDDELIALVDAHQRPGGWNPALRMTALAKYGSSAALERVKAIYESQQERCQPELMAYFVRVDPDYADRVFRRDPWEMQADAPPCARQYFERTPPLAMHRVLEQYMSAHLMHRDAGLKTVAARSLGRYGSKAALPPLWEALRYFHVYWKGKGAELEQNRAGVDLEVALRDAIARGRNRLATEADLRTIRSLCISERCMYETDQDLRAWEKPAPRVTADP